MPRRTQYQQLRTKTPEGERTGTAETGAGQKRSGFGAMVTKSQLKRGLPSAISPSIELRLVSKREPQTSTSVLTSRQRVAFGRRAG